MNVRFSYVYRDASNYKSWGSVVFDAPYADPLNLNGWADELRSLFMDDTFVAHQISIPEVFTFTQGNARPEDHCLHELCTLELTDEQPNDLLGRSFSQFLEQVRAASAKGWEGFDPNTPLRNERVFKFLV